MIELQIIIMHVESMSSEYNEHVCECVCECNFFVP